MYLLLLAPEGKIIIYGGIKSTGEFGDIKATPDLAVLNIQTIPFEWSVPKVSSNIGEVPPLRGHTANLVGDYMIVAFGNNLLHLIFYFKKF